MRASKAFGRLRFGLLAAVLVATTAGAEPPGNKLPRSVTPEVKAKLKQMVAQGQKLDAVGARPRFEHRGRSAFALSAAATSAARSGRHASDGIVSVPHFDYAAVSGGQSYPLMFVGSDPSRGGTTPIRNTIVPDRHHLAGLRLEL